MSAAMPVERSLQLSLVEGNERPVGFLPTSVILGHNADLVAAIAPLYLNGSVLDVTYGRGMWWRRFRPEPFATHDLKLDGVDFRDLPEADRSWDAVCFDPPYVPRHGDHKPAAHRDREFRAAYGLDEPRTQRDLEELIAAGLAECARIARRWLLVKCCDYTNGRQFHLGHLMVIREGERHGFRVHDLIVHASGSGPGGKTIRSSRRARRAHSYLVVFRRPGRL